MSEVESTRLHVNNITQVQGKLMDETRFQRRDDLTISQNKGRVIIDLGPEVPPIFPKFNVDVRFHYMEVEGEEEEFTYWVLAISWPISLFTKKRHVLVLKAARTDKAGNEIPMDHSKLN